MDSASPPHSIDTDTDNLQPVPEDDKFDSRLDLEAMEVAIANFSKALRFRKSQDIGIWTRTQFCPACLFLERWTRREFLSPGPLLWKQMMHFSLPMKIAFCQQNTFFVQTPPNLCPALCIFNIIFVEAPFLICCILALHQSLFIC